MKFWMNKMSTVALEHKTGVPSYQVEDEEGKTRLQIHLPIDAGEHRWCLWRPDLAGFDLQVNLGERTRRRINPLAGKTV
jgi:hypothetical protein